MDCLLASDSILHRSTNATWTLSTRIFATFVYGILTLTLLAGCGGGGDSTAEFGGGGGGSATPVGAAITLEWDPVSDSSVYAYYVHWGKQSSGASGLCNYTYSTLVGSPSATITGLDHDTEYFIAVSSYAYNGTQSSCSGEVSGITPSPA